jgi:phosphatidylglycerol lysyltransferase
MSHGIPQARPARTRTSHELPGRVHALVEEWGTTPYSRVALLPNYDHLVAGAVVSFMRSGRIALALDEPAGPPSALRGAVRAFSEHCRERGLHPAWVPVSGERLGLFLEEGFRILPIGLEGRVSVQELNLDESRFRSLRQSVRRAVREGVRVEVWAPPHGDVRIAAISEISDRWLRSRGVPERRFGSGWFDPRRLDRHRLGVLHDRRGRTMAFVSLLEGYRSDEGAVDLMRHRSGTPPGSMDALLTGVAHLYRREGRAWLNLGLSPLAGLGTGPHAGWMERGLDWAFRHAHGRYRFAGLHAFKRKFHPEWETRYLCYPTASILPEVLLAAAEIRPRDLLAELRQAR